MKLIFSFILIIKCSLTLASMVIIKHENRMENAKIVKEIFQRKYLIPNELIQIKNERCKEEVLSNYLELCINKKGELLILSSNIKFKIKSLLIFRQP